MSCVVLVLDSLDFFYHEVQPWPCGSPGLESALKWVFSGPRLKRSASLKKKKTNEELETLIEALRVRTASGAVILTLDPSSSLAEASHGFWPHLRLNLIYLNPSIQQRNTYRGSVGKARGDMGMEENGNDFDIYFHISGTSMNSKLFGMPLRCQSWSSGAEFPRHGTQRDAAPDPSGRNPGSLRGRSEAHWFSEAIGGLPWLGSSWIAWHQQFCQIWIGSNFEVIWVNNVNSFFQGKNWED